MTELELKIKDAAQKYYTDGTSPLTDAEFDALVDELKRTQPDSTLLKVGWGYDVKSDSTPGQKVKHKYGRAGSLEKFHNWNELKKDFKNTPVDFSLKLDGISCVLYYKNGRFYQALTRGDGDVGIDITDKVTKIFDTTIKPTYNDHETFTGAIRGELLMSYENFEKYAADHPDAKNPRNTTAGLINAKEITEDLKYVSLVVYTIVGWDTGVIANVPVSTIREDLENMFGAENVVPHSQYTDLVSNDQLMQMMYNARNAWYNKYPADGIVITKDRVHCIQGGEVTYDACAFKFPAESKDCKVVSVDWNMTKTRYAVPVIQIEPTQLSGTNVSFCAGFNAQWIKDNRIGPGAIVTVCKSGEIIPTVLKVAKPAEPQLIDTCPVCGSKLEWHGVHLQCMNTQCANGILQDTLFWLQNIAPTDGIGDILKEKMLNEMVAAKVIPDLSIESIMECTITLREDTESAQKNLFAKMWNNLHNAKVDLVNALVALNIPRISFITASKFVDYTPLIKTIMEKAEAGEQLSSNERLQLLVIGEANAKAVIGNMWKMKRLRYVWDRVYNTLAYDSAVAQKGKVAITGKLSVKRADFEKELRAAGFTPAEICRETCYLITDDPNSNSSKNKKADAWGIKKITEQEFRALYL
ncbi:MAG: hypothetical protein IJE78_05920 [Bacteroidaceae bacterium]|nr:hypothetical protein [Bacteroidaceae bacterium]